jgi:hypothetical protein
MRNSNSLAVKKIETLSAFLCSTAYGIISHGREIQFKAIGN